ncbi:MAG: M1 family metallopeptidase, partial [Armatimonadetes bacterium]|nr:M1 family metallopeptidase [Armatimonadota bacterium]
NFDKAAISGTVTHTLKTTKANAYLVFDCPKLKIDGVTIDGNKAKMESDGKVLAIPTKGKAGKTLKVRIKYHGLPEAGIYFVPAKYAYPAKTPVVYTQGEMVDNRYWMPIYDWPNDKATSQGTIHLPKGWKALSNGQLVGVTKGKKEDVWKWKISKPHATYLISLVAGLYDVVPDGKANVPVSIWVPQGLSSWGKAAFGGTDKVVAFYSKQTGFPYPWEKYSQSAVPDFMFGGMENVTCTTQTIGALFPPERSAYNDQTGLVAHELAHQWFGDTVTAPDWPHIWINEGWASFLPAFWTREKEGQEAYDMQRQGTIDGALYASIGQPDRAMVHSEYKDPLDLFDGFAYGGGAARMFMLMHEVGEDAFWKGIKTYLQTRGFQNVTTEQFFATMSKSTGKDLDAFRRQWFYIKSAPQLTLVRDGEHTIVKQAKYPLAYPVPLDFWLVDSDGKIEKRSVHLSEDAEVEIKGAAGRAVLFDPDCWLMAEFKYEAGYTPEEWARLYAVAPNSGCKARLIQAMGGSLPVALAEKEKSERILEGYVSSVRDLPFLLKMTKSANKRIGINALSALAGFPQEAAATDRLQSVWSSSASDEVQKLRALQGLFRAKPSDELAEAAWNFKTSDPEFKVEALRYWVGKDVERARALCLRLVRTDATLQPLRMEALRSLGRLKDAPGKREVYETLVGYLKERSNSPLRTAIGALAEYGDKAVIPLIEAHRDHSLVFVRRDVENALNRLSK